MRIILLCFVFTFLSCKGYESLTNTRTPFSGDNLRMDGYYYSLGKEFSNGFNEDYVDAFFLNLNGVYFKIMYGSFDSELDNEAILMDLDKSILKKVKNVGYSDHRPQWGVYFIENDMIVIENWEFASGAGAYPTRTLEGTIVNDTTIHFYKLIGAHPNNKGGKKKVKTIDETYHFRKFSPKADSTNVYIK